MSAEDVLKTTFKRLKQKNAVLDDVIDTDCETCCNENLRQVPIPDGRWAESKVIVRFLCTRDFDDV